MKLVAVSVLLVACSSKPAPAPPPPVVVDAGIDGITALPSTDPALGHLDDDAVGSGSAAPRAVSRRPGRPIEITLRSTPPRATIYVDGQALGPAPQFWQGEANGREHTFTFTLAHHATAVYRFVPVQSGVIHGRLEPVTGDADVDAGVPPAPKPQAITPPAPPPTVVTPPPPKPDAPPAPVEIPIDAAPSGVGPQP